MVGIETSLIMHPQVWKCSGHYDLFHDMMVDCKSCKSRFRADHLKVAVATIGGTPYKCETYSTGLEDAGLSKTKQASLMKAGKDVEINHYDLPQYLKLIAALPSEELKPKCPACSGQLTSPREFNLMFKTVVGALSTEEEGTAFLRPETAQGMFVNFKNVMDSSRVKIPFGIAQMGKSFRNEITPRNFTFRSREFEQMEMEFFCHPQESRQWYEYWRDRRYNWYVGLGITSENLILRDHAADELSHYSVGTADVEYAFPFLDKGEYGELEGIAHRGDFDLRSHQHGKLKREGNELVVEMGPDGKPKYKGSGKDLTYFDDQTRERYCPHVIEPAAGADRATLAFLCEAYAEDEQPDHEGKLKTRVVMRLHPQLAPLKAAVFPLLKKDGMPEKAAEVYYALREAGIACQFDQQGSIGKRYSRQDEIGTPFCLTIDGDTMQDQTVTIRDRDTLAQERIPIAKVVEEVQSRFKR
jgi:glycyl-tRNA synthetase